MKWRGWDMRSAKIMRAFSAKSRHAGDTSDAEYARQNAIG